MRALSQIAPWAIAHFAESKNPPLPFGLTNTPAVFQSLIIDILRDYFKAAVHNFYVYIHIRFTKATTRGDDTTLIKPFGSSRLFFFQYLFFLYLVSMGDITVLAHRK